MHAGNLLVLGGAGRLRKALRRCLLVRRGKALAEAALALISVTSVVEVVALHARR